MFFPDIFPSKFHAFQDTNSAQVHYWNNETPEEKREHNTGDYKRNAQPEKYNEGVRWTFPPSFSLKLFLQIVEN